MTAHSAFRFFFAANGISLLPLDASHISIESREAGLTWNLSASDTQAELPLFLRGLVPSLHRKLLSFAAWRLRTLDSIDPYCRLFFFSYKKVKSFQLSCPDVLRNTSLLLAYYQYIPLLKAMQKASTPCHTGLRGSTDELARQRSRRIELGCDGTYYPPSLMQLHFTDHRLNQFFGRPHCRGDASQRWRARSPCHFIP